MTLVRSVRFTLLSAAISVGCGSGLPGCGSDEDKKVVTVDEKAQRKTQDMLKQMQSDAKEKFAKRGAASKK